MRLVAGIEKAHEERYRKLAQNIKEDIVFKAGEETVWVCRNCGYIPVSYTHLDVYKRQPRGKSCYWS